MFRSKKDEAKTEQPKTQPIASAPMVKASVKNMGNGELELAGGTLSFCLKKGKQKDVAIKIPLDSIESMRQDGNQFMVVWNGITDRFTMKNSDLPKMMLEKVTLAQAELKNSPEPDAPQPLPSAEQGTPKPATKSALEQAPPAPLPEAPIETPKEEAAPRIQEPEEVKQTEPEPSTPPVTEATAEPPKEEPKEEVAPVHEPEETKQVEPEPPASPLPQEQPQDETTQPPPASESAAEIAEPTPAEIPQPPPMGVPISETQQTQAATELEPVELKEPEPAAPQPEQPPRTPESQAEPQAVTQAEPEESTLEEQAPVEPVFPEKPVRERAASNPPAQASVFKASVKNMGKGDLELAGNVLTFSLKKGMFGNKKTVAMKIPLESIEDKRQEENQLVIVWNGITDRFTLKDSNAPKAMLELLASAQMVVQNKPVQMQQELEKVPEKTATPEQVAVPIIPFPKVPEYGFPEIPATPAPEAIPTDFPAFFNIVVEAADPIFDLIRGLHGKVNWKRVEEHLKVAKDKAAILSDQTVGKAGLSFTKLSEAVKAHVPLEAGVEGFALLKTLREQIDSLTPKPEETAQGYPQFKSLQTALHAYYTLNDIAFGAELGDEASVKESAEFANLLDQLSKQTHSNSSTKPLKEAVAKLSRGPESENAVAECRALFKLQFEDQSRSLKYYSRLIEAEISTEA